MTQSVKAALAPQVTDGVGRQDELAGGLIHDVEAHAGEWEALARAVNAPPFVYPGWIRAWVDAFSDRQALVLATARDASGLVAVIPLLEQGGVVRAPANWHTPEMAAIGVSAEALVTAFEAALARAPRRVTLRFVSSDRSRVFREALTTSGYHTFERTLQVSPYALIDQQPPEGTERATASTKRDIARKWRRLLDLGALEVDDRDGSTELEQLLGEGFRIEGSGWKDASGTAIASHDRTRSFYSEIAAWAARESFLSLAFLRLDGRPLAFQFGLRTPSEYFFLKGGYDPAYGRYSPGKLLHARMIEKLQSEGSSRYEFLGDMEGYKRLWAPEARTFKEVVGYATSPTGTVDRFVTGHLPAVLRRLRRAARSRWLARRNEQEQAR